MNNQHDRNKDSFLDMPMTKQFNIMNSWQYTNGKINSKFGFKILSEIREGGQGGYYPTKNDELYGVGVENLLDFRQDNLILSHLDPFGKYFDSSVIWGPVVGRVIYAGIRYNILD